jgi:hypothetical protein
VVEEIIYSKDKTVSVGHMIYLRSPIATHATRFAQGFGRYILSMHTRIEL